MLLTLHLPDAHADGALGLEGGDLRHEVHLLPGGLQEDDLLGVLRDHGVEEAADVGSDGVAVRPEEVLVARRNAFAQSWSTT